MVKGVVDRQRRDAQHPSTGAYYKVAGQPSLLLEHGQLEVRDDAQVGEEGEKVQSDGGDPAVKSKVEGLLWPNGLDGSTNAAAGVEEIDNAVGVEEIDATEGIQSHNGLSGSTKAAAIVEETDTRGITVMLVDKMGENETGHGSWVWQVGDAIEQQQLAVCDSMRQPRAAGVRSDVGLGMAAKGSPRVEDAYPMSLDVVPKHGA
ncbi:uncharacterized protein [Coffea arabica]|uniref:Uncharacterized protein n=1 Tax=Coffea arabica TaxID=13443 RepID=A0ABM4UZ69_COFAR